MVEYKKLYALSCLGQLVAHRVDESLDFIGKWLILSWFSFHKRTIDKATISLPTFSTPTRLFYTIVVPHF